MRGSGVRLTKEEMKKAAGVAPAACPGKLIAYEWVLSAPVFPD